MRIDDISGAQNLTNSLSLLCQCEDPAKYIRTTPENVLKKKVTESNSIPGLTATSKPTNTDDNTAPKTDESKEMYHVPFLMRMPKDYEWNRLPEYVSSENDEKTMPPNVPDNQNRNISFESKNNPTANNYVSIERAWSMTEDYPSTVNIGCCWLQNSENASCMDNENRFLDFLGNETSSSAAKNKNSDKVDSSAENIGNDLDKVSETNQLGRSHGNMSTVIEKSRDVTARFKDLDNVSLETAIRADPVTNWTWQDTFDLLIIFWMINFCVMDLHLTACFIKEIIRLLR